MHPALRFALSRLAYVVVTLFVTTAALYGIVMLAPVESRAALYLPPRLPSYLTEAQLQRIIDNIIRDHHLDQPYPVQYGYWISGLLQGDWGWSPKFRAPVLQVILRRIPATAEITLYSALLLIPFGLISGVVAGWRPERRVDNSFRLLAFVATSVPPFILGLVLLSVFYVGLGWFSPGRTDAKDVIVQSSVKFDWITGLLTVDGLLNGRLDITLNALQHLALPVVTLSLAHWATLGRITRAAIIEESNKDYIVSAKARGLPSRRIVWRHALRNAIGPGLTSIALSAAGLITGVYVVEAVFNFPGLSELAVSSIRGAPDAASAMGFAIFSVLLVLPIMLALDAAQALLDPRLREGLEPSP
ncbi:MAG: ABC transporter permease [Anaerolineales bacterium]|nr:ABC transporter permease [Anaerolineales bacterium]